MKICFWFNNQHQVRIQPIKSDFERELLWKMCRSTAISFSLASKCWNPVWTLFIQWELLLSLGQCKTHTTVNSTPNYRAVYWFVDALQHTKRWTYLVSSKQEIQFSRLGVHRETTDEQGPHLKGKKNQRVLQCISQCNRWTHPNTDHSIREFLWPLLFANIFVEL